jgi:hypothetical protein
MYLRKARNYLKHYNLSKFYFIVNNIPFCKPWGHSQENNTKIDDTKKAIPIFLVLHYSIYMRLRVEY